MRPLTKQYLLWTPVLVKLLTIRRKPFMTQWKSVQSYLQNLTDTRKVEVHYQRNSYHIFGVNSSNPCIFKKHPLLKKQLFGFGAKKKILIWSCTWVYHTIRLSGVNSIHIFGSALEVQINITLRLHEQINRLLRIKISLPLFQHHI